MTDPQMLIVGGRRRGRPPRAETKGRPLRVRLSPAERQRIEQAADVNGQNLSAFMRDALVTAADDCLESNS